MPPSLLDIPFYGIYKQVSEANRQAGAQEQQQVLQQASTLAQLQQQMAAQQEKQKAAQRQAQFDAEIAAAEGDPVKVREIALRRATPDAVLRATQPEKITPLADSRPEVLKLTEVLETMRDGHPAKPFIVSRLEQLGAKPVKEQNQSNLSRLMAEKAALPAGDPQHTAYDNAIRKESETAKQIVPTTTIHNPAPVTPVTIQDPNDPNATIVIDGRTKAVLGKGPKLSQVGGAQQKLDLGLPQARSRVQSMTQNLDRLDTAMGELDADAGLPNITGTLAGRTPNLTNKATGAQAKLNSIKSQIFQASLQAMREASKTGGAVGNVSDREGDKLERTIAALDQAQGTPAFKDQLKKARAQLKISKEIINSAFREQYGEAAGSTPTGPAAAGPSIEDRLNKYK